MTAIAGMVAANGDVYIGADSAGVDTNSLDITVRSDDKVFLVGDRFLIGGTTSFRMLQILQYKLDIPAQTIKQTDMEYMVCTFIDAVKKCFKDDNFESKATHFLVGYKGVLYTIFANWQVGVAANQFDACGCGAPYVLGAMFANEKLKPEDRIRKSLLAAATFSAGVCGPFKVLKLPSEKSLVKKTVKKKA
jgi:ATP-dependent protease HslVU (ClpYQ) peptidase subunit